jgi:hypothetical protein
MVGIYILTLCCSLIIYLNADQTYLVTTSKYNYSFPYSWEEVQVVIANKTQHNLEILSRKPLPPQYTLRVNSSAVTNVKVFVSLTSISSRIHRVNNSISTMLHGLVIPTKVFLFVSRDAHGIDEGINVLPDNLLCLVAEEKLTIVYTENVGPQCKLLALLKRFYHDKSVVIMNIDDDLPYSPKSQMLYQLLSEYIKFNGTAAVSLRVRRLGICEHTGTNSTMMHLSRNESDFANHFTKYTGWGIVNSYGM